MKPTLVLGLCCLLAMSGGTCAESAAVQAEFDGAGVQTVVLRAGNADHAQVSSAKAVTSILVSAVPIGGAGGYHSPDPNWKETKPQDWGMSFVAKRFGNTLVISSRNETRYMHHAYTLDEIRLVVPEGVRVQMLPRALSGDGAEDLSAP
jgi:hypothetical protein